MWGYERKIKANSKISILLLEKYHEVFTEVEFCIDSHCINFVL